MASERLDLFPGPIAPGFQKAHELLDKFFAETEGLEAFRLKPSSINGGAAFKKMLALEPAELVKVVRAAIDRAHWQQKEMNRPGSRAYNTGLNYLAENTPQHFEYLLELLLQILAARKLVTKDEDIVSMLSVIWDGIPHVPGGEYHEAGLPWATAKSVLRIFKNHVKRNGLSDAVATEALAVAEFLRDPDTGTQARAATKRKFAEQLEFTARTGV